MSDMGYGAGVGDDSADLDDQLQQEDTLDDRGVDDVLDEGLSPPEQLYAPSAFRSRGGIDELLAEQEPDPASRVGTILDGDDHARDEEREWEFPSEREVGRVRAGRLVAPDMGFGEDSESELVADDVGISGGAASAEEAAVHVIDDRE